MTELEDCRTENARYRKTIRRLETQRAAAIVEVNDLEEEVGRLKAEGLQPLVDRLLARLSALRALVTQMTSVLEEEES